MKFLFFLPFVAIFGGVIWLMVWQARKARANLQAIAGRWNLVYTEKKSLGLTTDTELRGEAAGRPLRFWTYSTGSGKSRVSWCAVSVQGRPEGRLTFELRRRGFATKMMTLFGTKDTLMGDADFDAAWFVLTNAPDFLRAAFGPELRAKLTAASGVGARGGYKLEFGTMRYAEQGSFSSGPQCARLEGRVPLLQELADVADVFAAQKG